MPELAPIVLFCYNRPEHTRQTLQALSENILADKSRLYIFCDGPKPEADENQFRKIKEVQEIAKSKNWCSEVEVIQQQSNKGLANSVIEGVTQIVNQYGKVIVLEDDLITSKYFLEYMNTALEKYKEEMKVMQVSGHQFPVKQWKKKQEALFLPFTTSWGWATWKRAWDCFDINATGYLILKNDLRLRKKFDLNTNGFFSGMLFRQIESSEIDSWAIRWWWTVFSKNGLVLFPSISLISNIGFGEEATHTKENIEKLKPLNSLARIAVFPESISFQVTNYCIVVSTFGGKVSFMDKLLMIIFRKARKKIIC